MKDLGDEYSNWAMMVHDDDEILEEGKVRTRRAALERKFSMMAPALVAIEAGTHSAWVARLLGKCGHQVVVANPRKLRMIYRNDNKRDEVDARMLARVARVDVNLLSPIRHRGRQAQGHLAVLKSRDKLVSARKALVSHVRGVVKAAGDRVPDCSTQCFHKKAPEAIPELLAPALMPIIDVIAELTVKIRAYDYEIEKLAAEQYAETELFRTISGVGPVTSLAFALVIEQSERFTNSRDVAAHLGLTPRRDQSGAQDPQLHITKAGNKMMRRLLVSAAQYIIGKMNRHDSELRQWGLKLAGPVDKNGKHNKRQKKRAVVAVARKLAVVMHTMWTTGQTYDPFHYRDEHQKKETAA